jgi:hypothetical protein
MIDTLNSTHYHPVLPETSCINPEGMRDKSTHEFKKKKKKGGNASGAEVPREDSEEKSTNVEGEKRAQSVKK